MRCHPKSCGRQCKILLTADAPTGSKTATFSRPTLPRSINTKAKSFSEALRSSSPTSSLGDNTITTDNRSTKSAREIQLEEENAKLHQDNQQMARQLQQIQDYISQQQAKEKSQQEAQAADKAAQAQAKQAEADEKAQLRQQIRDLQQTVEALVAMRPPTPRKPKRHRMAQQQSEGAPDSESPVGQMHDQEDNNQVEDELMVSTSFDLDDPSLSTGEGPGP